MFDRAQAPFTASASFLMALQPLLVAHSKNAAGGFDYSVPSSVMVSEGLKLVISSALLCSQLVSGKVGRLLHEDAALEFFSYVLPALIYFVNNNCVFFILQAVDPTTFQLLSQMKTIFTGLLFRVFLKRRLTVVQYLAGNAPDQRKLEGAIPPKELQHNKKEGSARGDVHRICRICASNYR